MKKTLLILTMILLIFNVTGCGITNKEFITLVESYQIFDEDNSYEMKTVSDFIKKMDSYNDENSKIMTMVSTSWSEEKIKEDSSFIEKIKQDGGFVYDKNKYYGKLSVNVCIASTKDYSTKDDFTYVYLFSINDDKTIVPEASAKYYGSTYDYEDVCTESASIQDSMTACVLVTDIATQMYR